jgi:predicted RecB family nuclease
MQVDSTYVRGVGEVDWTLFFVERDVTAAIAPRLSEIPALVKSMHSALALGAAPAIEPSAHCFHPHQCEFWEHCIKDKPEDWVLYLPRLRDRLLSALREDGIERISDIPEDFPLRALQVRIRDVMRSGLEFVSPDLGPALELLGRPTDYLDFETMNPAIPPYPGGRPYEQIPFQWSLHRIDASGNLSHREFLADGRSDPHRAVAETLLAALGSDEAPILVYSSFEARVLDRLAELFPDLAPALRSVRDRLRDLLPIVRAHVYYRGFDFSFSLKSVAPALAPAVSYDDLDAVAEGAEASSAFTRIVMGTCVAEEEARLRQALLAYCRRDTLALVEVHRALIERSRS